MEDLSKEYQNIILCADSNILAQEEPHFIQTDNDSPWKDAWKLKGDNANKFTYDGKRNVYLMLRKIPFRSRLDRILFRSDLLEPDNFSLVEASKDDDQPSDHYGVIAQFSLKTPKKFDLSNTNVK